MDAIWDDQEAIRRVEAIVRDNIRLFRHFPDISRDDLVQDLLLEVRHSLANYRPGRGSRSFGGWVSMVAHRRLLNKHRDRAKRAEWDTRYARMKPGEVAEVIDPEDGPEVFEGECLGSSDGQTLVEWCESVRLSARAIYGAGLCRVGERCYRIDQLAPLAMLQARLDLSPSDVWFVLDRRPDLRAALGYKSMPGRQRLEDASLMLQKAKATLTSVRKTPEHKILRTCDFERRRPTRSGMKTRRVASAGVFSDLS